MVLHEINNIKYFISMWYAGEMLWVCMWDYLMDKINSYLIFLSIINTFVYFKSSNKIGKNILFTIYLISLFTFIHFLFCLSNLMGLFVLFWGLDEFKPICFQSS